MEARVFRFLRQINSVTDHDSLRSAPARWTPVGRMQPSIAWRGVVIGEDIATLATYT
jgi:hypothetical protein